MPNSKPISPEHTLLITDMDGTFLRDDKTIAQRNLEAVKRWTSLGGKFTIATGRSILAARNGLQGTPINYPAVVFNGSVIYDYQAKRSLWNCEISNSYMDTVREVKERYPHVGIEIMTKDWVHVVTENEIVAHHISYERLDACPCGLDQMPRNAIKVLFGVSSQEMDEFVKDICSKKPDQIYFIKTHDVYCEMLPEGINKGTSVAKLKTILNQPDLQIVGIGDFYNDLELLKNADYAIAPSNALEEVKACADFVTDSDNNAGAIADAIDHLLSDY